MMRKLAHVVALLRMRNLKGCVALLAMLTVFSPTWIAAQTPTLPRPKHIVIVVEENHSFEQVMNQEKAPYIHDLASKGALLTSFYALHHPSQPNYMVLFSGENQGVTNNDCSETSPRIKARSLGGQLLRNGWTFKGYAEDLPEWGSTTCRSGDYVRKHAPWISFLDVPMSVSRPFSEFPPDFKELPTVSMVIPNLKNDMHDPVLPVFAPSRRTRADDWIKKHLGAYAEWAQSNNSLLIITWDEDNDTIFEPKNTKPGEDNRVATIFFGAMVKQGVSDRQYTHVDLLKTIVEMYCLPPLPGEAYAKAKVIDDIWKESKTEKCPVRTVDPGQQQTAMRTSWRKD